MIGNVLENGDWLKTLVLKGSKLNVQILTSHLDWWQSNRPLDGPLPLHGSLPPLARLLIPSAPWPSCVVTYINDNKTLKE